MKIYQITFSFLEPSQGVCTVHADSEEEAIDKLRKEAEEHVSNVEVVSVMELAEIPKATEPEEQFEPLPENVIVFPGTATKQ